MKLALALLLTALPAFAASQPEKIKESALPNGLVVHEYKLANGMDILLVPDHSAPVFTYQMWMKVGSGSEKLDPKLHRSGLAHLFEHMMFRGTPKHPDGQFDVVMSSAGATGLNATTWLDRTNYFESMPKEALELTFQVESDRMANLALDDHLFKTELGAVFGEKKMRDDKPNSIAYDTLWGTAFKEHPYRYTTIGTTEELNSFTTAEAQYFYKTYYAPNNAALILIGDFEIPQALKFAEKYYGPMKAQEIPHPAAPTEPEQKEARKVDITHPLATTDLVEVGYKTPDINNADMPALEVISSILARGNGSWMEQELTQENIASAVSANSSTYRYPALFLVSIQMAQGKNYKDALKIFDKEIERLRDGKVSPAELERAKNQTLLSSYNDMQNSGEVGDMLGEALVSSGNYLRNFEILEQVKKVTVADVKRVAATYLVEDHSTTVHLSPAAAPKGKQ